MGHKGPVFKAYVHRDLCTFLNPTLNQSINQGLYIVTSIKYYLVLKPIIQFKIPVMELGYVGYVMSNFSLSFDNDGRV